MFLSKLFDKVIYVDHPRKFSAKQKLTGLRNTKLLLTIVPVIIEMWKKSGIKHTIVYFAEVLRLVVVFLDSQSRNPIVNRKTWVKIHRTGKKGKLTNFWGLPKKLPLQVKRFLVEARLAIHRGSLPRGLMIQLKLLLSMLSFFRACSPDEELDPKYTTITAPFSGVSERLDEKELVRALKYMGLNTLKVQKPSIFLLSSKSGPNLPNATVAIGLDTLGWILRPKKYFTYCKMCLTRGYVQVLTVFLLTSVLLLPVAFLCLFGNYPYGVWKPHLGKIAAFGEARGKVRLVGVTDYWTQILFRPLHDSIYDLLGNIPEDGTKDQLGPVKLLVKSLGSQSNVGVKMCSVQSLDLSAATDRLPIKLQAQILTLLGYPGDMWIELLDREWNTGEDLSWDLKGTSLSVRYSVGQPMGAYSSFAMLALTNHLLVNLAIVRSKITTKVPYGILGDDCMIGNRRVSKLYRELLEYLGVEVNPIKGFDGSILEFAKQIWTLGGHNLSPLGAKNVLLAIRYWEFVPSVLYELWNKMFPICFKLKPRKAIRARSKRRVRGIEVPFITPLSIFSLIQWLTRPKGPKVPKVSFDTAWDVRTLVRALAVVGPRSGLWYVSHVSREYLRGWDYDLYQKLFFSLGKRLYYSMRNYHWGHIQHNPLFMSGYLKLINTNIKFKYGEDRLSVKARLRAGWENFRFITWEALTLPFILPEFSSSFVRFGPIYHFIYPLSILLSPSILIMSRNYLHKLLAVLSASLQVSRVRWLRTLSYYRDHGFLSESCFVTVFLYLLTHDLGFTFNWTLACLAFHVVSQTGGFKMWVLSRVHWSRLYGFSGRNMVEDLTSPIFDPYLGVKSVIDKLSEERLTASVPFGEDILSIFGDSKRIKKLITERDLETKKKLELLEAKQLKRKWLIKSKDKRWTVFFNPAHFPVSVFSERHVAEPIAVPRGRGQS
jgi:hypothetical protein